MQTNWQKTTITFILGTDDQPAKITLQHAIATPDAKQVAAFGGYLAGLTGYHSVPRWSLPKMLLPNSERMD